MKFILKLQEGIYAEIEAETLAEAKEKYDSLKTEAKSEKFELVSSSNKAVTGLYAQLISLKQEGFFNSPKMLSEIRDRLKELAMHYPSTSFPPYLNRLIHEKILRRFKESREDKEAWVYVNYS